MFLKQLLILRPSILDLEIYTLPKTVSISSTKNQNLSIPIQPFTFIVRQPVSNTGIKERQDYSEDVKCQRTDHLSMRIGNYQSTSNQGTWLSGIFQLVRSKNTNCILFVRCRQCEERKRLWKECRGANRIIESPLVGIVRAASKHWQHRQCSTSYQVLLNCLSFNFENADIISMRTSST